MDSHPKKYSKKSYILSLSTYPTPSWLNIFTWFIFINITYLYLHRIYVTDLRIASNFCALSIRHERGTLSEVLIVNFTPSVSLISKFLLRVPNVILVKDFSKNIYINFQLKQFHICINACSIERISPSIL